MYNKCDKCNKMMSDKDQRKLVLDNQGKISTRCMQCYETYMKVKSQSRQNIKF
ncbi:MAG: hypothetical protein V1859_03625 [archaeon]